MEYASHPILENGVVQGAVASFVDITARKHAEEALRQRECDLRAAIAERERISEDLHDGILQSIYAIGLGLEACKPLISDQPKKSAAKLKAEVQRTIGQLNQVLEEVRNFIAGLESHILDGQKFDVVLRAMVNSLAASYSIPARVTVETNAAQQVCDRFDRYTRSIHEGARDFALDIAKTDAYVVSRRERKKVEMLFAHLKRILKLDRLRLRGPNGAKDEFLLAATAQNLRKMAKLIPPTTPATA